MSLNLGGLATLSSITLSRPGGDDGGASEGIKQAFGRDHNNDRNAALRLCALKVAVMIGEGME